jgi:superfamily II DNA or RNA helicase
MPEPESVSPSSTDYHAAYYAHQLTRRSASDTIAKIGSSLFNATVDLNPHQLDAALFAFRSPLSRGVLLADEVGLGKTIEAGLVISQLWAERKRRVLVVAPAILRKQWAQELRDKFFLDSQVVDTKEFNAARKAGLAALEPADRVVIASYHFAAARRDEVAAVPWDLVVIDEAHRLRNVYKPSTKIANAIKDAVGGRPLLLLTATPLQNDLLELYGLVSFIDEHVFGDVEAFKARYKRGPVEERQLQDLRERLSPLCKRTLRRQVTEYVRFTNRIPVTQDFTPTDQEQRLYDLVSDYLRRESLNALPAGQRKLMTLVLRKLLASSTYAIADTLQALAARLKSAKAKKDDGANVAAADFETFNDLAEEWDDEPADEDHAHADIEAEIRELKSYGELAASITINAKGQALLLALDKGFAKLQELGAQRKAVIFTESRRTQAYLFDLLQRRGYSGRVLTINGTNTDDRAGGIYKEWVARHKGEDVVSGNKTVDLRAALVEQFRDRADVLIATEAAAEGVNLQFCSLVVNYDLPWNPQRIEQRIGRCHRYGQQHDVVVINFLNRANAADQRVFELLSEKFKLFDGVFGSSDDVLGALESGVDFERRIAEIYQACRTADEIDRAFAALRADLGEQITSRMADTRRELLEHFDEEVHQRLRVNLTESRDHLGRLERWLWDLTRHELDGLAVYHADYAFDLDPLGAEWPVVPAGRYQFVTQTPTTPGAHAYRLGHPLAQAVIERARNRPLPVVAVRFDYTHHAAKIGLLDDLLGASGWLTFVRLSVRSLEDEDRLLFAALDHAGRPLHPDVCAKLFQVGGVVLGPETPAPEIADGLHAHIEHLRAVALAEIAERNNHFFEREIDKLDRWADDLKNGLEVQLKDLNARIKQLTKDSRLAPVLEIKLVFQKEKRELEAQRKTRQRELYEAEDRIDARKEGLITEVESRLKQDAEAVELFTIRWEVA